jgi:hypothetical protein
MSKKLLSFLLPALLLVPALTIAPDAEAKFTFPVNHPDLQWYSIETEHFVIHYPVSRKTENNKHYLSTEQSAREAARVAEQMWEPVCRQFNWYLKERINIVLLNQSDDLEGFTIPSWDWIEISTNPGSYFYRTRGRMEWMSDVLVHEFSHVVSLKAQATLSEGAMATNVGGLYMDGIHDVDTGVEFFVGDTDPWYWVEGGAEYWSDQAGYNWWTPARDLTIRMSVLEDTLLPFDEALTVNQPQDWQDGERGYQQGYSFAQYLRQRFGAETYTKFAAENSKKWRMNWSNVIEDVTGVPARQLWDDWKEYVTKTYTAQYDAVKAEGEVVGHEMLGAKPAWDYGYPSERDAWMGKQQWEREKARRDTGTWTSEPRYDSASGIWGVDYRASVVLEKYRPDLEGPISGFYRANPEKGDEASRLTVKLPGEFMHGWDFVPGGKQIVVTGTEHIVSSVATDVTGASWNAAGYNWKELWVYDIPSREETKHGRTYETWQLKRVFGDSLGGNEIFPKKNAHPIPNTLRASDPAVSPEGKRVAFLQYNDGTLNLATINIDGTGKKLLTNYTDGTWFQHVDWSPDGTQLVFSMFRNYQQNLYIINADGTGLQELTQDSVEEMDAHWAKDGKIYFSAEPKGINNIYSYDPKTKEIRQITNVIGAAECPIVTDEGNLIYSYYTSFGIKVYGLAKEEFLGKLAGDQFNVDIDQTSAQAEVQYQEDLSGWAKQTQKYRWYRSLMPPAGYPILRYENEGPTSWNLSGGFVAWFQDYVEYNNLAAIALLGEDPYYELFYTWQGWYPNISLDFRHINNKGADAYRIDMDSNTSTRDDIGVYDFKRDSSYNVAGVMVDLPWSDRWSTGLDLQGFDVRIRSTDSKDYVPYILTAEGGLAVTFSTLAGLDGYAGYSQNLPAGRNIELRLTHGYTDYVYSGTGGRTSDDGMLFDKYHFNKAELRWTEQINIPTLWGLGFLQKAREKNHRIQIDTQLGAVDRNVVMWNEFQAGGQHPYFFGASSVRPNTLFSGYPPWSLSGETMGMVNLAYRFPLADHWEQRVGPIYFYKPVFQIMGTAGNLWSFRPPAAQNTDLYYIDNNGSRIAYNPEDVHREIPFVDKAYKNGNYMLYDAGFEVRLPATMWNMDWNSFLRVSYGFNAIKGYFDVNGDGVTDTSQQSLGDQLSNEKQPAGFRVYIGLGTGW